MAVTQISRIQIRSGDSKDLPDNLAEGEFGFTLDEGGVYLGAPRFAPIQHRGASLGTPGTYPYRNIKILTELDTQYTVSGDVYYHGPLKSMDIAISGSTQTLTTLMSFPNRAYGIYDYSITAQDGSEPRRMGTFIVMTDGSTVKFQDNGIEFKTDLLVTGVTLDVEIDEDANLTLTADNASSRAYVLQLSGREWAAPIVPTP